MDIEQTMASLTRHLQGDPRVSAAIVFGSVARGTSRADSDLDLAVLPASAQAAKALDEGLLQLGAELSLATNLEVQLVLLDRVEPVLGRQVFVHGRTLFDKSPELTARTLERILIEYFDGAYHRRMGEEALDRRLGLTR